MPRCCWGHFRTARGSLFLHFLWVFRILEGREVGGFRWDEICRGEYLQCEAGWLLVSPRLCQFCWFELSQHIIVQQSLLPRDAPGASAMNKFKKPLEEIRDSRSFKGC